MIKKTPGSAFYIINGFWDASLILNSVINRILRNDREGGGAVLQSIYLGRGLRITTFVRLGV